MITWPSVNTLALFPWSPDIYQLRYLGIILAGKMTLSGKWSLVWEELEINCNDLEWYRFGCPCLSWLFWAALRLIQWQLWPWICPKHWRLWGMKHLNQSDSSVCLIWSDLPASELSATQQKEVCAAQWMTASLCLKRTHEVVLLASCAFHLRAF